MNKVIHCFVSLLVLCSINCVAQTAATITVDTTNIIAGIDSTMVGFSFNPTYIGMNFSSNYNGSNSRLITNNLFRNFYPYQQPTIRINGTNNSYWSNGSFSSAPSSYNNNAGVFACAYCPLGVPSMNTSVTTGDVNNVKLFVADLQYKPTLLWGLNFSVIDTARISDNCAAVKSALSTATNLSFEIGNEPDLYLSSGKRLSGYDYTGYLAEFNFVADKVKHYGKIAAPVLGKPNPTSSGSWAGSLSSIISSIGASNLSTVTFHDYPLGSAASGTLSGFLNKYLSDSYTNDDVSNASTGLKPSIQTTLQNNLSFRLAESNTLSNGGMQGVSNTMGSALWGIDMMFELAKANSSGINFAIDGGSTNYYSPFTFNSSLVVSGSKVLVNPLYYGALLFARAAQNKGTIISNTVSGLSNSPNIKVWSVMDHARIVRVLIINRGNSITDNTDGNFTISLPGNTNNGYLYKLSADATPNLQSTAVTLAGQKVDANTGNLSGTLTRATVTPSSGNYTVTVPAGTAALFEILSVSCNCNN